MEWSEYPLGCYDNQSTCGAKKFDPRQKRKGLKAWSSGFSKETKLLEIPDPKIACQNLKI